MLSPGILQIHDIDYTLTMNNVNANTRTYNKKIKSFMLQHEYIFHVFLPSAMATNR